MKELLITRATISVGEEIGFYQEQKKKNVTLDGKFTRYIRNFNTRT